MCDDLLIHKLLAQLYCGFSVTSSKDKVRAMCTFQPHTLIYIWSLLAPRNHNAKLKASSFCPQILGRLQPLFLTQSVCVFQVLSPEEQALAASNDYNFDHPGAFDFELLVATLRKLKQGKSVKIPVYDFTTHRRQKDWVS